jgi:hypothetical protein
MSISVEIKKAALVARPSVQKQKASLAAGFCRPAFRPLRETNYFGRLPEEARPVTRMLATIKDMVVFLVRAAQRRVMGIRRTRPASRSFMTCR